VTGATSGAGITLPEHMSSLPHFSGVRVARSLAICVVFCRSLFVLFSFFFWPLCCLFFFDLQILITPSVSSNSSLNNLISPSRVVCVVQYCLILHDIGVSLDIVCFAQNYVCPINGSVFANFQYVKL